ncbi:hypothetical protein HSBAA_28830 [Vreelandella sulfidaeris]|uniref:Prephenate/arogenate dehydrogenase domain-containing protein n=1 Tax=Vreelandella sulfidaeris TaxID=115553 RepID=A0A455U7R8_9GAMM|nr:hypothetical protein HSBAA_28830 [Halomonas sulfidaeris]
MAAANPRLYVDHKVILTPEPNVDRNALERVRLLWQACGADVLEMDVERHDQVLARTSHLPHLLAFSLVDTLARQDERLEIFVTRQAVFVTLPALQAAILSCGGIFYRQ